MADGLTEPVIQSSAVKPGGTIRYRRRRARPLGPYQCQSNIGRFTTGMNRDGLWKKKIIPLQYTHMCITHAAFTHHLKAHTNKQPNQNGSHPCFGPETISA
ncbi:hypothetical protein ElyMa_003794800 [Elysia marginata]|uniref:C2H2-type domain-containing protein n=1 Tax=Elysia marginata TaxID=1093978 RepID=A0AAV4FD31_9GAST|nr:hypothetical protein ElyMa_003794800 [Elysia marginata]